MYRIANGRFNVLDKSYSVAVNNGTNHLHGGLKALDKQNWKYGLAEGPESCSVMFSYHSPDGEEGYPGNVNVMSSMPLFAA